MDSTTALLAGTSADELENLFHKDDPITTNGNAAGFEQRWWRTHQSFSAFVEREQRLPRLVGELGQERELAQWRFTQSRHFRNGRLSAERQAAVEGIPGWVWPQRDSCNVDVRDKNLALLNEHVAEFGTSLTCFGLRRNGVWLHRKTQGWREQYHSNRLTKATVDRLEALPDWSWDRDNADVRCLLATTRPELVGVVATEPELRRWRQSVRAGWFDGTASSQAVAALDGSFGWQWFGPVPQSGSCLDHPIIVAGIECLRVDLSSMPPAARNVHARRFAMASSRMDGAQLEEIAKEHGVTRQSVQRVFDRLVPQATHPVIARHANEFFNLWCNHYAELAGEGPLTRTDIGQAVSFLRHGTLAADAQLRLRPAMVVRLEALVGKDGRRQRQLARAGLVDSLR